VAILGDNLQFVTAVRIGDEPVTVTFQDEHKILIQPAARDPGFENLNLLVGNRRIQTPIEFTPSLKAEWIRPDRFHGWPAARLRLTLHPGATGTYMILYSSRRLMTGNVYPGTYHCELLDMTAASSGMLTCGAVNGDEIVRFPLTIPLYPRPSFFAQAYCVAGLHSCYSNLVAPMFDMTPSP